MIVRKRAENETPLTTEKTTMELRIEANLDIEKIVQPSDIGAIIPPNANVILITDGNKHYVNSTSLIDAFIAGEYDEYEITCIRSENYGWLTIDLAKLED